jgi:hypothetical protein
MQAGYLIGVLAVILTACSAGGPPASAPQRVKLTASETAAIGKKIWQNECAGTVIGLTTWNVGEEFPSLGIGHFIWYPKGFRGRFSESWPSFVTFARARGLSVPAVALEPHSPWSSRGEFQSALNGPQLTALRAWLAGNVAVQTDYIITRSQAALPKILDAAPPSERERIAENYRKVSSSPQGIYALMDYVNFKGDGTQVSERYQGQGWGLLQVLGGMKNVPAGPAAATEFAASARRTLSRRIENSPKARGEKRWEVGWHQRCNTYGRPL